MTTRGQTGANTLHVCKAPARVATWKLFSACTRLARSPVFLGCPSLSSPRLPSRSLVYSAWCTSLLTTYIMVVTRRTPAAPVPTSRNPSSQPIPRVAKKPILDTSNVPGKPSPLSNGSTLDSSNRADDVEVDKAVSVFFPGPSHVVVLDEPLACGCMSISAISSELEICVACGWKVGATVFPSFRPPTV